jgi:hypothetical protein
MTTGGGMTAGAGGVTTDAGAGAGGAYALKGRASIAAAVRGAGGAKRIGS